MKSNNFYKNKMAEEIEKRIASSEWNSTIASAVLNRRNSKTRKILFSVSISTLAAAAAITLVFSGILNNKNDGLIYDEFITAQIKGTYDAALPAKKKIAAKKIKAINNKTESSVKTKQTNEEIMFSDDIDSLISETLALR